MPSRKKPAEDQPKTSDVASLASSRIIDSRRLWYFYHVVQGGSFTAAEATLDIVQSALSRQIQQLEIDLDAKLLERRGHGVEPTAAGRVLLRHATEVLERMGVAVDEINETRLQPRERVSLAVSRPFSTAYIPDVLTRFRKAFPQIHVSVYEASSGQVYEMLTSGVVDLAVVLVRPNSPRITTINLFEEELLVIGRSDDPTITTASSIKRAELPDLKLVLPAAPFGTRGILERYFQEGGIDIDAPLRFDSVSLMKEMIQRDAWVAILPEQACAQELASGEFTTRALRPALRRTLRLASLRDHKQPDALNALRDTLLAVVRERHDSGGQ